MVFTSVVSRMRSMIARSSGFSGPGGMGGLGFARNVELSGASSLAGARKPLDIGGGRFAFPVNLTKVVDVDTTHQTAVGRSAEKHGIKAGKEFTLRFLDGNGAEVGEWWKKESTGTLIDFTKGKELYCYLLEGESSYERGLGVLFTTDESGKPVNITVEMARKGALAASFYMNYGDINFRPELLAAQKAAKDGGLGIWSKGSERYQRDVHVIKFKTQSCRLENISDHTINLKDLRIGSLKDGEKDVKKTKFLDLPELSLDPGWTVSIIVGKSNQKNQLNPDKSNLRIYVDYKGNFWDPEGATVVVADKKDNWIADDVKSSSKGVVRPPEFDRYIPEKADTIQAKLDAQGMLAQMQITKNVVPPLANQLTSGLLNKALGPGREPGSKINIEG